MSFNNGNQVLQTTTNPPVVAVQVSETTPARVTLASLPVFASDAAAGAGGLTAGMLYRRTTGAVFAKL